MGRKRSTDHLRQGAAVLARMKAMGVPRGLRSYVTALGKQQSGLEKAARAAGDARSARDAALDEVGAADTALDQAVDVLADKLVGARISPRTNAFRGLSRYVPSRLKDLGYADEVREVGKLVTAVRRKKPPVGVAEAAAACAAAAARSSTALRALSKPQAAYARGLAARDALLPAWKRAYERLRVNARAVWIDDPALYRSVFAPPDAVAGTTKRPKRPKRPKRRAAKATDGAASRATGQARATDGAG